ncbi:MAG: T9SS type A sorting domain-containing protein [Sphingobacteriales bacterium]|nr:MAG: T9SS type A sorting domain-containing protein [Sphingobacteriales bacterium]
MKKTYTLLVLLLLAAFGLRAQSTVTTGNTLYSGGNGYGTGTSGPVAVTFNVTNNNVTPITILSAGYANYYCTGDVELWYTASSLTGNTSVLVSGWTKIATHAAASPLYSFTIDDNFFTGFSLSIPGNTTYRFAAVAANNVTLGFYAPSPSTFTTNNVKLDVSNCYWGYSTNMVQQALYYGYIGSVTFTDCNALSGLVASNVKSQSATVAWGSATGVGYEYVINTSATSTSGTATLTTSNTVNLTALTPATTYYLHVRNKCSSTSTSAWSHMPFTTKPPCSTPTGFKLTSLTPTSAAFEWNTTTVALNYDYIVDQSTTPSVTGAINTLNNNGTAAPLTEATKYYVHIRQNCDGEQSDWMLDSFTTPVPCRKPVVATDYINTTQAVAYWDDVNTATEYEYAVTKSNTPPAVGTVIQKKSILLPALLDGVQYYVHVKSHCISQKIESESPWTTVGFKTFPLGVNQINGDKLGMEVFPNPAQSVLNLKMNGTLQNNATISLVDISGRVLKQMPVTQKEMTMDISSYAPGIYQLRYNDDVNSKTIKVVKE